MQLFLVRMPVLQMGMGMWAVMLREDISQTAALPLSMGSIRLNISNRTLMLILKQFCDVAT